MFTSLARCSRVNACRKLDQGGQAKGPVAARFNTSSRQRGSAGSGPVGRRHFGSGSGGGGAPFAERSLAPHDRARESGCVTGGATGSVSDLTVRLTQRKRTPTRGSTPPETKRRRPSGDGQRTVTAGVRGTNRHVTRGRGRLRATAFGWCPKGYSASPRRFLFRPQHGRAGQRAAIDGVVRPTRFGRSRMGGSQGCSLTTSRLQRLVRSILCGAGRARFGENGTRHTSTTRRPITVTGGKLERVARVLALCGHSQISL